MQTGELGAGGEVCWVALLLMFIFSFLKKQIRVSLFSAEVLITSIAITAC